MRSSVRVAARIAVVCVARPARPDLRRAAATPSRRSRPPGAGDAPGGGADAGCRPPLPAKSARARKARCRSASAATWSAREVDVGDRVKRGDAAGGARSRRPAPAGAGGAGAAGRGRRPNSAARAPTRCATPQLAERAAGQPLRARCAERRTAAPPKAQVARRARAARRRAQPGRLLATARAARRRDRHAPGRSRAGGRRRADGVHAGRRRRARSRDRAAGSAHPRFQSSASRCWSNCGAQPGERLPGTIREIAPAADPQARTYAARVTLVGDAAQAVELGQSARVYVQENGNARRAQRAAVGDAARRERRDRGVGGRSEDRASCSSQPVQLGPLRRGPRAGAGGLRRRTTGSSPPAGTCCAKARRSTPVDRDNRPVLPPMQRVAAKRLKAMRFNLSEWALRNRSLVLYAMLVLALIGAWSYQHLGQSEDPPFTFKVMVMRTLWPGATAEEVVAPGHRAHREEADGDRPVRVHPLVLAPRRIAGASSSPRLDAFEGHAGRCGTRCARRSATSAPTLPQGVVGPFFNDEFGDTFGNIYALTGEGFDYAVLKDYAERIAAGAAARARRRQGRADRPAGREDLDRAVQHQAGHARRAADRRCSRRSTSRTRSRRRASSRPAATACSCASAAASSRSSEIREFPIRVGDRTFRLGDVADVRRGFSDPPAPRMRFMGEDAIGIAVAMKDGGDILAPGRDAGSASSRACRRRCRPAWSCARSPTSRAAVEESVGEFVRVLDRGGGDRAAGELLLARLPHRPGGGAVDPAGAGDDLRGDALLRHRPAQDLARRAGAGARACWSTTRSSRSR